MRNRARSYAAALTVVAALLSVPMMAPAATADVPARQAEKGVGATTPSPGRMCSPREFGNTMVTSKGVKVRCVRVRIRPPMFSWVRVR